MFVLSLEEILGGKTVNRILFAPPYFPVAFPKFWNRIFSGPNPCQLGIYNWGFSLENFGIVFFFGTESFPTRNL